MIGQAPNSVEFFGLMHVFSDNNLTQLKQQDKGQGMTITMCSLHFDGDLEAKVKTIDNIHRAIAYGSLVCTGN